MNREIAVEEQDCCCESIYLKNGRYALKQRTGDKTGCEDGDSSLEQASGVAPTSDSPHNQGTTWWNQ
jgi:hypothetical protein